MEDGVQICAHKDKASVAERLDSLDVTEMLYPENFQGVLSHSGVPSFSYIYREERIAKCVALKPNYQSF